MTINFRALGFSIIIYTLFIALFVLAKFHLPQPQEVSLHSFSLQNVPAIEPSLTPQTSHISPPQQQTKKQHLKVPLPSTPPLPLTPSSYSTTKQLNHPINEHNASHISTPIKPSLPPSSPPSTTPFIQQLSKQKISDPKIIDLYGKKFDTYTNTQQEFIEKNLDAIENITQKYLKYPSMAGEMGVQGKNVIEFDLHPNGDITNLKLLRPSGYQILDKNSIKTIEYAYKDYPHPGEITHIRIYVTYSITQ